VFLYKAYTRPGREHHCADAMSRLPKLDPDRSVIPEDNPFLALEGSSCGWVAPFYGALDKEQPVALACVLAAQTENQQCQDLRDIMDQKEHSRVSQTKQGRLVPDAPLDGAVQVYIPLVLRQDLLRLEHDVVRAVPLGVNRMDASIWRHYYWDSMAAVVFGCMASCTSCARSSIASRRRTAVLILFPVTGSFASMSMDLLGPLTETRTGNVFRLNIFDRFSKLVRAVPVSGITATDVSLAFCRDCISVYRPPDTVMKDIVPQFTSLIFRGVCTSSASQTCTCPCTTPRPMSRSSALTKRSWTCSCTILGTNRTAGTSLSPCWRWRTSRGHTGQRVWPLWSW